MSIEPMDVEQIETAIRRWSTEELAELVSWLEAYHAQVWDARMEQDLGSGRLDAVLAEADEEYKASLATPL